MTRLFLFASAATLAIASAAYGAPGGGKGNDGGGGGHPQAVAHGGGGGGGGHAAAPAAVHGGGGAHFGGGFAAPRAAPVAHGGGFAAPRMVAHGGFAGPRAVAHGRTFAGPMMAHGGERAMAQGPRFAAAPRGGHFAAAPRAQGRVAAQQAFRMNAMNRAEARIAARQAVRVNPMNGARAQVQARSAFDQPRFAPIGPQGQRIAAVPQRVGPNAVVPEALNPTVTAMGGPVGYGVGGCPPGLAKKAIPCVPPGLAAKLAPGGFAATATTMGILDPVAVNEFIGQPLPVVAQSVPLAPLPVGLEDIYPPTPQYYYEYGDGYAYQVDRSSQLIDALLPLFGLGYSVGQPFPAYYNNSYLPPELAGFYPDTPYANYNYDDGYVYQVDPTSGLIQDIIPTLGYGYGVGQMLPANYSVYNLPYQYRPYYTDTAYDYYRYAPGSIYQVDPSTGLIQAVVALLTSGLNVGQPLPMGYDAYNLPMAYRSQYYDTPNTWYRYADGDIYSVDPVTGMVTGVVQTVV